MQSSGQNILVKENYHTITINFSTSIAAERTTTSLADMVRALASKLNVSANNFEDVPPAKRK